MQALKTGFTLEAGYNLAVSAWRDGQQFIMIVLGSRTRTSSFLDAKKLLKYGFVEAGLERGARAEPGAEAAGPRAPHVPHAMSPIRGYVFDAYGTLFDVHSVVEAGREITSDPATLSTTWRQKQLEYTWLRALMGTYADFWVVTEAALRYSIGGSVSPRPRRRCGA